MEQIIRSLKVYVILTVFLGLGYPLLVTIIAHAIMPAKADGSLLVKGNRVVGSSLIGQNFTGPAYFHGRPSANSYDGANSGGTNLGPASKKLMEDAAARIKSIRQENGLTADTPIPADMALSSASGLDAHISVENALLQAPRVSKTRHIPLDDLKRMITGNTDPDFIGIWGRPGVNVLKLNIAVDACAAGAHG